MPYERQIYLLDPQKLDAETIAVTFAKTSRSPQSFQEIASELTAEKSADFHEKWVVGYGHASVAEHAVLHIAVENISRLAVECLESNRLASYTEKSTRYQKWKSDNFFIPPELSDQPLRKKYEDTCSFLFTAYQQALAVLKEIVAVENPSHPGESTTAWENRLRSLYADVARFYLPAAALANVGITINARALGHALRKMLSHPLQEVRDAGLEIKNTTLQSIPTLLKYIDVVPYLRSIDVNFTREAALQNPVAHKVDWCRLTHYDPDGEERILAAALYRYGSADYPCSLEWIKSLPAEEKMRLARFLVQNLGPYDIPLHEAEYTTFTYDVFLDQGAYFELKRHRMMTQSPQRLSTRLGFALPSLLVRTGLQDHFCNAMQIAAETYEEIAKHNPEVASYIVPNAYNRRVLLCTNLRSLHHLVRLRTAPNAHFSIRRAVARMAEQAIQTMPVLGNLLLSENLPDWREIEQQYFFQTA